MKLSEIAAELAKLDGRKADDLHIRLRNPLFKSLLQGTPGRAKNSPADYDRGELIRARLLVAASDCGMSTEELARMNGALNKPPASGAVHAPSARAGGALISSNGLHSIIRGAKHGEDWVVSLRFTMRAGIRDVLPIVSLRVNLPDDVEAGRMMDLLANIQADDDGKLKRIHIGTLTLPAADLVKPIVDGDHGE